MISVGYACDTCVHRRVGENYRVYCPLYYPEDIPVEVFFSATPPPQCAANGSFERTEFWKKELGEK